MPCVLIPVSPGCHAYFPARLTCERAFSTCYVCSHPGVSATIVPASITTSLCWGCGWKVSYVLMPVTSRPASGDMIYKVTDRDPCTMLYIVVMLITDAISK